MMSNVLGKKIKDLRKARGLTQSQLAGEKVTRNMLSGIENGTANPSLETLRYLAEGLSVSVAYLISEENDLVFFEKKRLISKIYRAYEAKNYTVCISLINDIPEKDEELYYLLAVCHLELAKKSVAHGALLTALGNLELSKECSEKTKIDTKHIEAQIPMYYSIAKNIQSPLLEFDAQKYHNALIGSVDFEFFKYLTLDFSYAFETPALALHMESKKLMKDRNYVEAVKRLLNATELSKKDDYNAFVVFSLYSDLEYCYKQLYDYEKAYMYSSKRMTLLESFKT